MLVPESQGSPTRLQEKTLPKFGWVASWMKLVAIINIVVLVVYVTYDNVYTGMIMEYRDLEEIDSLLLDPRLQFPQNRDMFGRNDAVFYPCDVRFGYYGIGGQAGLPENWDDEWRIPSNASLICMDYYWLIHLNRFAEGICSKLDHSVIVYVGGYDYFGADAMRQIVDCKWVSKLFALSPLFVHPKLEPYPIGPGKFDNSWESFYESEKAPKKPKAIAAFNVKNSKWDKETFETRRLVQDLSNSTWKKFTEIGWAKRQESLQHFFGGYQFVISPRGKGIDCFRTWQALHVGSIPIVKSSPIKTLYTDLPVVVVDNWEDLSMELLQRWLRDFEERWDTMRWEKLTSTYWKRVMKEAVEEVKYR